MDACYTIVSARPRDVPALAAIELAAATLLEDHVPRAVLEEATDEATLREAQASGHLWVALVDDVPVGFAHVEMLAADAPHLEELDVHPGHGRRGIGAALVRTVCEWAARRGHADVTLTTFRHVRWNMPFYARMGFEEVPAAAIGPALAAVVADEAARGLDVTARVAMRYRLRTVELPAITGRTRMLGLIADPVIQARSPGMATALLREWGRLGTFVLLPMQVRAGSLEIVVAGLRRIENFAGALVSMPHKSSITALLDELTPEARSVGAVNVVRRTAEGRLIGTILDGEGFVAGLASAGHEVAGKACLLVGAGGAASAIAFALAAHGCASLTITNRTASRAESLAARVRAAFPCVEVRAGAPEGQRYDLAINGTSLGMKPDDALPMSDAVVAASTVVAECVLAPEKTRLLEVAGAQGRVVHTGVPMLTAQMELMLRFMGVA